MKHATPLIALVAAWGFLDMVGAQAAGTAPQPNVPSVQKTQHVSLSPHAAARRPAEDTGASAPKPHAVSTKTADPLSAAVIDDKQLADARGGTDTHLNENNTNGTVAGNVASQLTTGNNTISESAFSNSSGIPIVIQNTGNNVLIQNSTILNLQLTSPK